MQRYLFKRKQSGGATLLMSLVLAIAMGLMTVYSAQVTMTEQKISANQYRTKQGFEAAQAGLDAVIGRLNVAFVNNATMGGTAGDLSNFTRAGIKLPSLSKGGSIGNSQSIGSYTVKFEKNNPLYPDIVDITVSGFSGDNQSTSPNQIISQSVSPMSMMAYKPPTPLIAQGKIDIGGSVSLINKTNSPTGDLPKASWSGGRTKTDFGGVFANIDVTSEDGTLDGGSGIYERDAELKNLSSDDFFENFFSENKQRIKNRAKLVDCSSGCSGNDLLKTDSDGNKTPIGQIIWVETQNPGGTSGILKINSAIDVGSQSNPVLLIVNGKIEIDDNNAHLTGILYTTEDFINKTGAGNIIGSLISEGNVSAEGSLNLTYDNNTLATLENNTSRYIRIAGTWKDFGIDSNE